MILCVCLQLSHARSITSSRLYLSFWRSILVFFRTLSLYICIQYILFRILRRKKENKSDKFYRKSQYKTNSPSYSHILTLRLRHRRRLLLGRDYRRPTTLNRSVGRLNRILFTFYVFKGLEIFLFDFEKKTNLRVFEIEPWSVELGTEDLFMYGLSSP